MEIKSVSDDYGDGTSKHDVTTDEELSFEDFVLKFSKNTKYGRVKIHDDIRQEPEVVVIIGEGNKIIIENENYYEHYKTSIVEITDARGGWGMMDVTIMKFKS